MTDQINHSERAHSNLGPSSAHRWVPCPGSIEKEIQFYDRFPDKRGETSVHSREGTMAHELVELMVGEPTMDTDSWMANIENDEQFNLVEMVRHAEGYTTYVLDQIEDINTDVVLTESRLRMPRVHKTCYGTGDNLVIHPLSKRVDVTDLKYGSGQYVEVKGNVQGLMYAEGAREVCINDYGFEPEEYIIHIYQPRTNPANINHWVITRRQLDEWILNTAAPAANLASSEEGKTVFNPGEKQCYWCKGNGNCEAQDNYMTQARQSMIADLPDLDPVDAIKESIANVGDLTPERKGQILKLIPMMTKYLEAVKSASLSDAMEGNAPKGFKMVAGRNSYECNDPESLEFLVSDCYKPKELKSRSALQKDLGTAQFRELGIADLYTVREGNPTLAPEEDKRPALIMGQKELDELPD